MEARTPSFDPQGADQRISDSGSNLRTRGPVRTPSVRPSRLLIGGCIVLCLVFVLAHGLIELGGRNGLNTLDSGVFAEIGRGLLHGRLPYRDFWDHKPPGIYFIDALIFGVLPANPWSLHVGELAAAILTVAAFFWLARQLARPAVAAAATTIFAYLSTLPLYTQGGPVTETFWQLPVVLSLGAFVMFLGARPSRQILWLAGFFAGLSVLLKPQGLVLAAAMVAVLLLRRGVTVRKTLTDSGVAIAGLVVITAPVLLWLALAAGWPSFSEQMVTYNLAYSRAVHGTEIWAYARAHADAYVPMAAVWLVALVVFVAGRRFPNSPNPSGEGSSAPLLPGYLLLTFVLSILASVSDRHFYAHDVLITVPATCALLAYALEGWARGWRSSGLKLRMLPVLLGGVCLAAFAGQTVRDTMATSRDLARLRLVSSSSVSSGSPAVQAIRLFPILSVGGASLAMRAAPPTTSQRAALAIDHLIRPGRRLYVFGGDGGMYFVAARPPASRFLYDSPLIGWFGGVYGQGYAMSRDRRQLMADLRRRRPALIAVRGEPIAPESVRRFPVFGRTLCSGWRIALHAGGYWLYRPAHRDSAEALGCLRGFGLGSHLRR